MPLRTPFLRKPASGRRQRRFPDRKQVVSLNMISLPLGDFRHLSHIGSAGHAESFGDLSFLQGGRSLLLQSSRSEQNLFLACAPPPKPPRAPPDEPGRCSPIREHPGPRQKSSSLPLLDAEDEVEAGSAARGSLSSGRDSTQTDPEEPEQSDSAFTFRLDLGPSILDAVLQVMDGVRP